MMKRFISVLMILALALGVFAGCASSDGNTPQLGVSAGQGGNVDTGKDENSGAADNNGNGDADVKEPADEGNHEQQAPGEDKAPSDNANQQQTPPSKPSEQEKPEKDLSDEAPADEEVDYSDYFTVVSYNIKQMNYNPEGGSLDRKADVAKVLRQLDGDIVGLQEVDEYVARSGNIDQMQWLAAELGYPYYRYVGANREGSGQEGHGILSRYMIKSFESISFKWQHPQGEHRKYSKAVLLIEGTEVTWYNTHLTTGTWDETGYQYQELLEVAIKEKAKRPVIITADFNLKLSEIKDRTDTSKLLPLNGLHQALIGLENVSYDNILISEEHFDYYFGGEGTLAGIMSMRSDASDHDPIWTYLKLKNNKGE